jgi:hypothetical protein
MFHVDRYVDKSTISVLKKILLIGSLIISIATLVIYLTSSVFPLIGYLLLVPGALFVIATIYISRRHQKT